jgi:hypothetical protein
LSPQLDTLERLAVTQHDQLLAFDKPGIGLRIEFHVAILALNGHDDDAEAS